MGSTKSYLRVENKTMWNITKINVSVKTNSDWDDRRDRPDRNFEGQAIEAGKSLQKPATLASKLQVVPPHVALIAFDSATRYGNFTMTLTFSDYSVDIFSIDQLYATGDFDSNFNHSKRSHTIKYDCEKDNTLVITISNTAQQIKDHNRDVLKKQVEKILNEANKLLANLNYQKALEKFNEAHKITNKKENELGNELNLIQKLQKGKTDCLLQLGKLAMDNAGKLEKQLQSSEAMKEFDLAKSYFEEIQKLGVVDCKLNLDIVSAKIDGSKLFNEAVDLDEAGLNLYKKNHSSQDNKIVADIKSKYEQALNKYEQAKKIFEQGYQLNEEMFAESLKIVNVAINEVQKSLEAAISNQLLVNFTNMYLKDDENEKTVVNQEEKDEEEEEKKEEEGMIIINQEVE